MHAQTDSSRLVFAPLFSWPAAPLVQESEFSPLLLPFLLLKDAQPPQRPSKGYFCLPTYSECPYSICIAKQAKSAPKGTKVVFAKLKNTSAHKCHCTILRFDTRAKKISFCELNNFFFFFSSFGAFQVAKLEE